MEKLLIPDNTIISDLLEGIRVERAFYTLFTAADFPISGQCLRDELIGFFFVDGDMTVTLSDREPFAARRRDFVLISRGEGYTIAPVNGTEAGVIGRVTFKLDGSRARLFFRLMPERIRIPGLSADEMEWHTMLERLVSSHPESFSWASSAINHRLIEAAIIGIVQMSLYRDRSLGYQFDQPEMARLATAIRLIHAAPENPWTVTELAAVCGLSRSLFADIFVAVTGDTPGRYLAIVRMEKAQDLLRIRALSLADVAHRSGYGTDMAFIRAFKRHVGMTPGRFRAAMSPPPTVQLIETPIRLAESFDR